MLVIHVRSWVAHRMLQSLTLTSKIKVVSYKVECDSDASIAFCIPCQRGHPSHISFRARDGLAAARTLEDSVCEVKDYQLERLLQDERRDAKFNHGDVWGGETV